MACAVEAAIRLADRAFRQVVALDPEAPMGYWGLALANELYPRRSEVFLQRANFKLSERAVRSGGVRYVLDLRPAVTISF